MNQLMVFDGANILATKIAEEYGISDEACTYSVSGGRLINCANNKLVKSISTSGQKMYIEFRKTNIHSDEKAEVVALIKYNKFAPECQTWLDLTNKELKSPDKYGYNFNCNWLISYEIRSYVILCFTHINVSSDFLSISSKINDLCSSLNFEEPM